MTHKAKEKMYLVNGYITIPVQKQVMATSEREAFEIIRSTEEPNITFLNSVGDIHINDWWFPKKSPRPSLEVVGVEEQE